MKQSGVASEIWAIVSYVVKVAVGPADGDVERGSRRDTQDWGEAQLAEITGRSKRPGKNKAMPPIQQAARPLGEEIPRYYGVGSVYDSVVRQMGKRVGAMERKTEIPCLLETLAKFERQAVIETIARGNKLLDVRAAGVGAQRIQGCKRDLNRRGGSKAIEIYQGNRHSEFRHAPNSIRIRRIIGAKNKSNQIPGG